MKAPVLHFECDKRWGGMPGTDVVRHCGDCDRKVTDLSALDETEARAAVAAGGCVTYLADEQGTIVLESTRRLSLKVLRPVAVAAAFAMAACSQPRRTVGELEAVPLPTAPASPAPSAAAPGSFDVPSAPSGAAAPTKPHASTTTTTTGPRRLVGAPKAIDRH